MGSLGEQISPMRLKPLGVKVDRGLIPRHRDMSLLQETKTGRKILGLLQAVYGAKSPFYAGLTVLGALTEMVDRLNESNLTNTLADSGIEVRYNPHLNKFALVKN